MDRNSNGRFVVVAGQSAFRAKTHKADVQSARSDKGDFDNKAAVHSANQASRNLPFVQLAFSHRQRLLSWISLSGANVSNVGESRRQVRGALLFSHVASPAPSIHVVTESKLIDIWTAARQSPILSSRSNRSLISRWMETTADNCGPAPLSVHSSGISFPSVQFRVFAV